MADRGERKRRGLTVSLAASILSLLLISWGGWAWTTRQYANRARATGIAVNAFLSEAARKRETARTARGGDPSKWVEALEESERVLRLAEKATSENGDRDALIRLAATWQGISDRYKDSSS